MFDHSVTVPRNYKIAANIVQKVSEEGGSVKTLLYDDKLKHFRVDVLYALVSKTIKHAVDIEKIFKSTDILVKEPRLNPWLARVLTAELLYGKKSLPGNSKPVQTILSYKEQLMKLTPEVQDDQESKVVRRPRYVRINTNLLTTSDAIRAFQDDGYKFIRCTSASYDEYLQQVQNLTEYDFTQDYHVKTIFVFSPRMKLHNHDLYMENKIILQDKATALPVHLLAPPPGSVVLDMCAAPGMKTTQLAAYMRNEGKVYAVERDDKRYVTLCNFVESTGSKCVETLHKDSLEIKRGDLDDVEYILLDPSCSGSGMDLSVHSYVDESRMAKLTSIQEKFLKHAMNSFPNAKRIVYSTCSIFPEENERVVTNVVKASRAKWRVRNVKKLLKDQWNNFGSGMYGSMGTRCLYAKPDNDLTIGFFLAVLDRDMRDSEKQQDENKVAGDDQMDKLLKYKSKKHEDENDANIEKYDTKGTTDQDEEIQHTEKKNRESNKIELVPEVVSEGMNDENNILKRKKKKRNKVSEISIENEDLRNETTNNNDEMTKIPEKNSSTAISKNKIRKSKVKDEDDETNIDINISIDVNAEDAEKNSKEKQDNNGNAFYEREVLDDFKTDTKHDKKKKKRKYFEKPEISETKIFENNVEIEMPKKKKKKHNHRETESQKNLTKPVKNILTDVEYENTSEEKSELLEDNDKKEMPRKKKKKRKDRENEPNEAVSEIVIDTSMKIENNNTSRNITKLLIENIDGIEKPKKVNKKHKARENEPLETTIDVASESEHGKAFKKANKKKNAPH